MSSSDGPFAGESRLNDVSARRAARAQWQKNTAGVILVRGAEEGTSEFFDEMTRTRYEVQPWHPALLREWAPRGTVLEVGCGAGTDNSVLRETAERSIAIDLAIRGASLTRSRVNLEGGHGVAVVADGEHCPVSNEAVDAVYSFGVIHHTDNPECAVAEIARVLRPDGSFFVAVYHRYSLFALDKALRYLLTGWWHGQTWRRYLAGLEFGGAEQDEPPVIKLYSRRRIRRIFTQAGFTDVYTTIVHPYGFGLTFPRAFNMFGWYVIVRGRKP